MNEVLYMLVKEGENEHPAVACYLDKEQNLGSIIKLNELDGDYMVVIKDRKLEAEFPDSPTYTVA